MLRVDCPTLKDFEDVVSVEYRIEIHLGEQFSDETHSISALALLRVQKWED